MRTFLKRWLSRGVLGRGKREAVFVAAEVGNVAADVLAVTFSRPLTSPGGDYVGGVTVEKNGAGQPVTAAVLQGDGRTIHYTLASPAAAGDSLTWAYTAGGGDWVTVRTGNAVASIAARSVVNNLAAEPTTGGALVFSTPANSGHIVSMGA